MESHCSNSLSMTFRVYSNLVQLGRNFFDSQLQRITSILICIVLEIDCNPIFVTLAFILVHFICQHVRRYRCTCTCPRRGWSLSSWLFSSWLELLVLVRRPIIIWQNSYLAARLYQFVMLHQQCKRLMTDQKSHSFHTKKNLFSLLARYSRIYNPTRTLSRPFLLPSWTGTRTPTMIRMQSSAQYRVVEFINLIAGTSTVYKTTTFFLSRPINNILNFLRCELCWQALLEFNLWKFCEFLKHLKNFLPIKSLQTLGEVWTTLAFRYSA